MAMVDEETPAREHIEPEAPEIDIPLHILTARQRLVLTLLYDDEKSVAEVASILDVNEQTVRSTKHKALERLRSHFQSRKQGSAGTEPGQSDGDDLAPINVEN